MRAVYELKELLSDLPQGAVEERLRNSWLIAEQYTADDAEYQEFQEAEVEEELLKLDIEGQLAA